MFKRNNEGLTMGERNKTIESNFAVRAVNASSSILIFLSIHVRPFRYSAREICLSILTRLKNLLIRFSLVLQSRSKERYELTSSIDYSRVRTYRLLIVYTAYDVTLRKFLFRDNRRSCG